MATPVTPVDRNGIPVAFVPAGSFAGRLAVLAQGANAVTHTGDTNETVLASVTIPGGLLSNDGGLAIEFSGLVTNNANVKSVRVRLGGIGGDVLALGSFQTVGTFTFRCNVFNRNEGQQIVSTLKSRNVDTVVIHEIAAAFVDTSVDQELVATAQLADAGDSVTLDCARVELFIP